MIHLIFTLILSFVWAAPSEKIHEEGARIFEKNAAAGALELGLAAEESELISLSQLADRLAQDPKTLSALIDAIRSKAKQSGKGWPGLGALNRIEREKLVRAIQTSDKTFLDSFPVMTPKELKKFIILFGKKKGPLAPEAPYPASEALVLTGQPREAAAGAFLKDWGRGFFHGDHTAQGLPTAYGDNMETAKMLNRLSMNEPGHPAAFTLLVGQDTYGDVRSFLEGLMKSGHSIGAKDMRFFANFGGLWYQENQKWISVMTPLYVDTGLRLPSGKKLTVPVSHSHLELNIRGPLVNADMVYYLGVGGNSMFYPLATADKPWVGGRAVKTWTGAEAVRLAERAAITRRELNIKVKKYGLPLGGYGPLGSCGDIQAMITETPIYPQIRDPRYYNDGMTIDGWAKALPIDGQTPPDPRRVYDSLPVNDPEEIKIPQAREMVRELKAALEQP